METSALNATNVEQAFTLLVTSIYQKKKPKQMDISSPEERSSATVSIEPRSTRTVSVSYSSSSKSEKPIRPSFNEFKKGQKKAGCCVVS